MSYLKIPKYSDTWKTDVIILNLKHVDHGVMCQKDADRSANCVDPDQTAPDLGLPCLLGSVSPKT